MGCINFIKDALSECSIKQRLRWLESLSAAVPDAWASLKADITLFQADDTVKEALLGWSRSFTLLKYKECSHAPMPRNWIRSMPLAFLTVSSAAGALAVRGERCSGTLAGCPDKNRIYQSSEQTRLSIG